MSASYKVICSLLRRPVDRDAARLQVNNLLLSVSRSAIPALPSNFPACVLCGGFAVDLRRASCGHWYCSRCLYEDLPSLAVSRCPCCAAAQRLTLQVAQTRARGGGGMSTIPLLSASQAEGLIPETLLSSQILPEIYPLRPPDREFLEALAGNRFLCPCHCSLVARGPLPGSSPAQDGSSAPHIGCKSSFMLEGANKREHCAHLISCFRRLRQDINTHYGTVEERAQGLLRAPGEPPVSLAAERTTPPSRTQPHVPRTTRPLDNAAGLPPEAQLCLASRITTFRSHSAEYLSYTAWFSTREAQRLFSKPGDPPRPLDSRDTYVTLIPSRCPFIGHTMFRGFNLTDGLYRPQPDPPNCNWNFQVVIFPNPAEGQPSCIFDFVNMALRLTLPSGQKQDIEFWVDPRTLSERGICRWRTHLTPFYSGLYIADLRWSCGFRNANTGGTVVFQSSEAITFRYTPAQVSGWRINRICEIVEKPDFEHRPMRTGLIHALRIVNRAMERRNGLWETISRSGANEELWTALFADTDVFRRAAASAKAGAMARATAAAKTGSFNSGGPEAAAAAAAAAEPVTANGAVSPGDTEALWHSGNVDLEGSDDEANGAGSNLSAEERMKLRLEKLKRNAASHFGPPPPSPYSESVARAADLAVRREKPQPPPPPVRPLIVPYLLTLNDLDFLHFYGANVHTIEDACCFLMALAWYCAAAPEELDDPAAQDSLDAQQAQGAQAGQENQEAQATQASQVVQADQAAQAVQADQAAGGDATAAAPTAAAPAPGSKATQVPRKRDPTAPPSAARYRSLTQAQANARLLISGAFLQLIAEIMDRFHGDAMVQYCALLLFSTLIAYLPEFTTLLFGAGSLLGRVRRAQIFFAFRGPGISELLCNARSIISPIDPDIMTGVDPYGEVIRALYAYRAIFFTVTPEKIGLDYNVAADIATTEMNGQRLVTGWYISRILNDDTRRLRSGPLEATWRVYCAAAVIFMFCRFQAWRRFAEGGSLSGDDAPRIVAPPPAVFGESDVWSLVRPVQKREEGVVEDEKGGVGEKSEGAEKGVEAGPEDSPVDLTAVLDVVSGVSSGVKLNSAVGAAASEAPPDLTTELSQGPTSQTGKVGEASWLSSLPPAIASSPALQSQIRSVQAFRAGLVLLLDRLCLMFTLGRIPDMSLGSFILALKPYGAPSADALFDYVLRRRKAPK